MSMLGYILLKALSFQTGDSLTSLKILDSGPMPQIPFLRTCVQDFYILKKNVNLSWI